MGTATAALNNGAGPSFLFLDIVERGVIMAVVVDQDQQTTLPVGSMHRLLSIKYERGPHTVDGVRYPIHYCDRLGDPAVDVLYVVHGFEVRPETLPGSVGFPKPIERGFIRADANGDGRIDISDATFTLNYLFRSGEHPPCFEAANSNGGDGINIADPIYTLQFKFRSGPPPPPPYPGCGTGPAPLGCIDPICPAADVAPTQ